MYYFATTVLGLEDVAASELEEILGVKPEVDVGKIFFKGDLSVVYRVNYFSRTINRVFIMLLREEFETLEDIYRHMKSIDYTWIMEPNKTFAIRSERVGNHPFTSIDIARIAGKAVIDSYMESTGVRLRVNLDNPDVEIWVFARNRELLVGVNTTGESLHKRRYRVYNHPAALKPTIAASMLRLGGYRGQPLLDPLCGGGTIAIEAAHAARKVPIILFRHDFLLRNLKVHNASLEEGIVSELLSTMNNELYEIYCMDVSPKHLEGAMINARSARVGDTIRFLLRDSTRKESHCDVKADLVVTNPPYGIRSHRLKKIGEFYETLLRVLADSYKGKRLVIITASTRQLEEAASKVGLTLEHSRHVMHGGLPTKIYVYRLE